MSFCGRFDRELCIWKCQYFWPLKVISQIHMAIICMSNIVPSTWLLHIGAGEDPGLQEASQMHFYIRSTCARFVCAVCFLAGSLMRKPWHWKIKLQVASIVIRFMWCHFNWKCILHKSDEIIWTWLMFQCFLRYPGAAAGVCNAARTANCLCKARLTAIVYFYFLALIVCKPLGCGVKQMD